MKYKVALLTLLAFFAGCSNSHQIMLTSPAAKTSSPLHHSIVGIYAPDSLINYSILASISGGACEGHAFELHIGAGIVSATEQALYSIFDSVITFSILPSPSELESRKITYIVLPRAQTTVANSDFNVGTFSVTITGVVKQDASFDVQKSDGSSIFQTTLHCTASSSGKGDCHDGALYLKNAGTATITELRDSIINKLGAVLQ
ncbi:MAG TPA: hypothetical protein VEW28_05390 [Candidatus Kapabacteria bacterium]|nr:hypothetical protein [Candidatus Kapabacteria bacterium]